MGVRILGIELRGGLQFAKGLLQPALVAQGQTQAAVGRLHFRLNIDGLAERLFRLYSVVPA